MKTSISGWLAKNYCSNVIFFEKKPTRKRETLIPDDELEKEVFPNGKCKKRVYFPRKWESNGKQIPIKRFNFNWEDFIWLNWQDEPVKVTITLETNE